MAIIPPPPSDQDFGLDHFERVVLAPYRAGQHPRHIDLVQPRRNHQERRPGEKQDGVRVYQDKESGIEPGFLAFEADDAFYAQMNVLLIKRLRDAQQAIDNRHPDQNPPAFQLAEQAITGTNPMRINAHISLLEENNPQTNFIFKKYFGSGEHPECEKLLMQDYMNWRKQLSLAEQPNMKFLKGDFSDAALWVSVGAKRTMVTSSMKKLKNELSKAFTNILGTMFGMIYGEKHGRKLGEKHGEKLGKQVTQSVAGSIYNLFKRGRKKKKNVAFLTETITNNLAVTYGMQGQTASIRPGAYKDGTPMLVNEQTWAKGFQSFEGRLKGGDKKSGSCFAKELDPTMQALVKEHHPKLANIKYQSDPDLRGVPQSIAFLLQAADYDVLGSTGGNKGYVNNEFYGIDFGHSFGSKINPILFNKNGHPNLRDDFRFKQTGKTIKHMDAFYDHPLSEMMQGIYFLMKQNGKEIPKHILEWYQSKALQNTAEGQAAKVFLEKLNTITPGSAMMLFDAYIKKFSEAANHNPGYKGYAKKVAEMRNKYIADRDTLLSVFEKRMQLTPDQLTLIENMEKFLCDPEHIRNISPDGTVLLNHLRVDFDHRIPCQLVNTPAGFELNIDANEKVYARFEQALQKFAPNLADKLSFEYDDNSKKITLFCPNRDKAEFMQVFQENNIAKFLNKPTGSLLQTELNAVQTLDQDVQDVKVRLEKHHKMRSSLSGEQQEPTSTLVTAYGNKSSQTLKELAPKPPAVKKPKGSDDVERPPTRSPSKPIKPSQR